MNPIYYSFRLKEMQNESIIVYSNMQKIERDKM